MAATPKYRRVLLKVSGEALMGAEAYGIDIGTVERIAADVKEAVQAGHPDLPRHRRRQHLPRAWPARPRASTARPPTIWACWPR